MSERCWAREHIKALGAVPRVTSEALCWRANGPLWVGGESHLDKMQGWPFLPPLSLPFSFLGTRMSVLWLIF